MAPRPGIDAAFVKATVKLARRGLTNAEIERALQQLTARMGKPAPSYSAVRRIANEVRRQHVPNPYMEEIALKLATGRLPDLYWADVVAERREEEARLEAWRRSK